MKIPRRRAWQPTPAFLPGESRGQGFPAVQGVAKSQAVLSIKAHGASSVSRRHQVRLLGNHSKGDCFYWEKYPCSRVLLSTFYLELAVQQPPWTSKMEGTNSRKWRKETERALAPDNKMLLYQPRAALLQLLQKREEKNLCLV